MRFVIFLWLIVGLTIGVVSQRDQIDRWLHPPPPPAPIVVQETAWDSNRCPVGWSDITHSVGRHPFERLCAKPAQ